MPRTTLSNHGAMGLDEDYLKALRLAKKLEKQEAKRAKVAAAAAMAAVEEVPRDAEEAPEVEPGAVEAPTTTASSVHAALAQMAAWAADASDLENQDTTPPAVVQAQPVVEAHPVSDDAEGTVVLNARMVDDDATTEADSMDEMEAVATQKGDDTDVEEAAPPAPAPAAAPMAAAAPAPTAPAGAKKLFLYSATVNTAGKRPMMECVDAGNDLDGFSSLRVKRCKWIRHAPAALLGVEMSPNKACTALRDATRPGSVVGASGVNQKVALCVNATGKPILLKQVLENKALRTYLQ